MKKLILIAGCLTIGAFAAEFSKMTLQELNDLRDKITAEDKQAYVTEIRKRAVEMTAEEKARYEVINMIEGEKKPAN